MGNCVRHRCAHGDRRKRPTIFATYWADFGAMKRMLLNERYDFLDGAWLQRCGIGPHLVQCRAADCTGARGYKKDDLGQSRQVPSSWKRRGRIEAPT